MFARVLAPVFIRLVFIGVSIVFTAGVASAQDYPNKTIRIITAAVGGGSDFIARQIAGGISGPMGQPVVVENRGGVVTAEMLAKAPPDGYTVSLSGANLWITQLVQKVSYDTLRDFAPVSMVTQEVMVLAVHPSLPVKSVKELIALAKAKPGQLNFGSDSPGGPPRLSGELFKSMAGVDIVNVSYKGTAPAVTALLGGEIQLVFVDSGLVAPHAKSGKLRSLAVTSAAPSALVPGLPTIAEAGLPGYECIGSTGVLAPAKTPPAIVNRLNQEIVRFLNRPDTKERLLGQGEETVGTSPEQYTATIKNDLTKWEKVMKDAGIKIETRY